MSVLLGDAPFSTTRFSLSLYVKMYVVTIITFTKEVISCVCMCVFAYFISSSKNVQNFSFLIVAIQKRGPNAPSAVVISSLALSFVACLIRFKRKLVL